MKTEGQWKGHKEGLELDVKEQGGFGRQKERGGVFSASGREQGDRNFQRWATVARPGQEIVSSHFYPAVRVVFRLPVSSSQQPSDAGTGIIPILAQRG